MNAFMTKEALYGIWILAAAEQKVSITHKALKHFPSFEAVYSASLSEFNPNVFSEDEISHFMKKDISKALDISEYCDKNNISVITYYDDGYPPMLHGIENPPILLFVKGNLANTLKNPLITIVGTRSCSTSAGQFTAKISRELAQCGFTIVSGVASGIDMFAQKGALSVRKPNIAVLPCGVDIYYSKECKELYSFTEKYGAIISEYLPKTYANRYSFKLRNRILSGISHATLVVESPPESGALITAEHARRQGRPVFAVPKKLERIELTDLSGTNDLLSEGALECNVSEDIINRLCGNEDGRAHALEQLRREKPARKYIKELKHETIIQRDISNLTTDEQKVYLCVAEGAYSIDNIVDKTQMSFGPLMGILQRLELLDYIECTKGGNFKKKN